MSKRTGNIISKMEAYFAKYVSAPKEYYFVASLWAAMTHIYKDLDTVPYLTVTALTKRSGKTLFTVDLLKKLCFKALDATGMTGSVLYRLLEKEQGGVLVSDEAESMGSEASGSLRRALNIGFKRGATYPVTIGGEVVQMPTFGPKAFVLIGEVNDTLRDRSIVFYMKRATPDQSAKLARYVSTVVEGEALELITELGEVMAERRAEIIEAFRNHEGLNWMSNDRDAEIWLPLFVIAQVLCPERVKELTSAAADMCADKTQVAVNYNAAEAKDAEKKAERAEFAVRLLTDLAGMVKAGDRYILTDGLVDALKALPTGPWRRYKGRGINEQDIGYLLPGRLGSKNIKVATKPKQIVRKGWMKADILANLKDLTGLADEIKNAAE